MEDKIRAALDNLSIEGTDKLLSDQLELEVDQAISARIKESVYRKAEVKKPYNTAFRRLAICAGIAVILFGSLSMIGFHRVAAAINNLFSFIPGYGIVENNDRIHYIAADLTARENAEIAFTLLNAIAGENDLTVMFEIQKKNPVQDKQDLADYQRPQVYLYAGDSLCEFDSGLTAGSESLDNCTYTFKVSPENINPEVIYTLDYPQQGLSLEFYLKEYESFRELAQIGATDIHNHISLTAVPEYSGDDLSVELYPINKSAYSIYALSGESGTNYQGQDLHLQTSSGIKPYLKPASYSGPNTSFKFKLAPDDQDLILKIPYILVQSSEEQVFKVPIPEEGEIKDTDIALEFKDCIMRVKRVERANQVFGELGALKLSLEYEPKTANMVMLYASFMRVDIFNRIQGGGWSAELDQNGVYSNIYFALEKGDSGTLRLKAINPVYYLLTEYTLALD